jgi:hypothetical protein
LQRQECSAQHWRAREIGMVIRERAEFDHGARLPQAMSRFHASRAEGTRRRDVDENGVEGSRLLGRRYAAGGAEAWLLATCAGLA